MVEGELEEGAIAEVEVEAMPAEVVVDVAAVDVVGVAEEADTQLVTMNRIPLYLIALVQQTRSRKYSTDSTARPTRQI